MLDDTYDAPAGWPGCRFQRNVESRALQSASNLLISQTPLTSILYLIITATEAEGACEQTESADPTCTLQRHCKSTSLVLGSTASTDMPASSKTTSIAAAAAFCAPWYCRQASVETNETRRKVLFARPKAAARCHYTKLLNLVPQPLH